MKPKEAYPIGLGKGRFSAEPWPDEVDVRDSYGYLWKTIPQAKARQLVESGVAEAVGFGSVKYVRLSCSLSSGRNDANRTTERIRNDAGVIIAPRNHVKHIER